ncbi:hypothetical protein K1719_044568 [Acacia pycnantha]|nr:hypothetical protein K1719_044568 [Acacia pycnantha]
MKEQKRRYLKLFWSRVENKTEEMDKFKKFLEDQEKNIRKCYAENLCDNFNREKLVEMMLLDSVFIMELFLRIQRQKSDEEEIKNNNEKEQTCSDDIILKQSWLNKSIQRDLLLLENQIPLFILEKLYKNFVPNSTKEKHATFIKLARDYFVCYQTMMNYSPGEPLKHFTDLIRSFYICKDLNKFRKRPLVDINFKKVKILSWFLCLGCIPNSKYFKARLQIPELKVDDTTECVLRNLIAFEQCHYPNQPYICNYVSFIDSLIHTKDDVELLVEKEVIMHELGSDKEVATLVNGLCKHVVTDKTCYADKINSLNKHYQRQWYRTMAALRLVYFRDAWRASSTLVATPCPRIHNLQLLPSC